jgi:hypothetical protein
MTTRLDDLNGLRLLSQICEVDNNRYQDVILIGGAQRILQILRAHLVMHATLLPDEIEMQRKGMRFFERVLAKEPLRFACFQAGCAQLYLDILEMDKSSLKNQAMDCLSMLCEDKSVQAEWHTLGAEHTARLAHFLQRFSKTIRLCVCVCVCVCSCLCSCVFIYAYIYLCVGCLFCVFVQECVRGAYTYTHNRNS